MRMDEPARRYAVALYGLTHDEAALREAAQVLTEDKSLWDALRNPGIRQREKERVLARVLTGEPLWSRFFALLCEKGRLDLLPDILEEFHALGLKERNAADGVLRCVIPPDEARLHALEERLKVLHHRAEVHLEVRAEPELLGGFVVELEGVSYDRSVRGRLDALGRKLGVR